MLRQTRTYAILEVSEQTYKEIYDKLVAAGYYKDPVSQDNNETHPVIDMHGIALAKNPPN